MDSVLTEAIPEMMFAAGEEPVGVRVLTYQSSRAVKGFSMRWTWKTTLRIITYAERASDKRHSPLTYWQIIIADKR